MQDDAIYGLFEHFLSEPTAEGDEPVEKLVSKSQIVAFARAIEISERAACANEIHNGHKEYCCGANCDCQNLHRLIRNRTGDEKFRADVIAKASPEVFDAVKSNWINDERLRFLACIEAAFNALEAKHKKTAVIKNLKKEITDYVSKAPIG